MSLDRLHLAADAGFWPAAARAVLAFAAQSGAPARQLQSLTWVVPSGGQAESARAALRDALGPVAFIPPRIVPFAAWLGEPPTADLAPRLELYAALRANRWVGTNFGAQPATLWQLAGDIARLCDELTLAAVDHLDAFDQQLQASLARHFRFRAARALQAPAQLVLQLWRARRQAADGAAWIIRAVAERVTTLEQPLVVLGAGLRSAASAAEARWESAWIERAASRVAVLQLVPDVAAAVRDRPVLAAAWPELVSPEAAAPIAVRADGLRAGRHETPLQLSGAATLEEAATVAARQTLTWLQDGVRSIALVVLDRLAARRMRALLERAEVMVRDETGWKLSTTRAAAAVMRWYDLVEDDAYWRDLLDWLKSGFALTGRTARASEVAMIERAIRSAGVVQGAAAVRRALNDCAPGAAADALAGALQIVAAIEARIQATLRVRGPLRAHAAALSETLDALGIRDGLAADPVGRAVLQELDALEQALARDPARGSLADFRALLEQRFEEAAFVDRTIDSPVVMVTLAAAALRRFDAALLIGADARHLPAAPADVLFLSNAVRAELGLATADEAVRAQSAQLAALLAATPSVVAVWQARVGDEINPLSPLLERLQFVCRRAFDTDLRSAPAPAERTVEQRLAAMPRPQAPGLLPGRISASHAQSLVDCPYQFYARRMLGLAEPEDVIELPDKRDFGLALHEVLRRFHRAWGDVDFDALDAAELAASLRKQARAVFLPQLGRTPGLLAYERRFDGLVDGYVGWLQQHARAGWRWRAGEENHTRTLVLRGGQPVELGGRVDRVDATRAGHACLIDYKARDADALRKALSRAGEEVQLPFYGMLLPQPPESAEYLCFDRARDGAPGVVAVAPPDPFDVLMEQVGARLRDDLERIAAGAALPAIGAPAVCARCEMRGLCRRDYWERGDSETGGATGIPTGGTA
jgi:ATP-dependent helicase/nuclease subunit B